MATIQELQKKLTLAGSVTEDVVRTSLKPIDFYNLLQEGTATISEFTDYSYRKMFDANVIETWQDKMDYFTVSFSMRENYFTAKIHRYFDDYRKGEETYFIAYITLPPNYIFICQKNIEYKFNSKLNQMYKKNLEEAKQEWIENKIKEILE